MPIVPVQPQLEVQVTDFKGPWTRIEQTDVPPKQALLAANVEYNPGSVKTRFGYGVFWNVGKALTSLVQWIKDADLVSTLGSYLFVYNKTDSKVQFVNNLLTPALHDAFSVVAEGISQASYGNQCVLAAYRADGTGADQARFFGIDFAAVNIDRAFLGPLTTKPVLNTTPLGAAGYITPGDHRVGYIITTRNGYTGKISPVTSDGAFDITSVITTVAGDEISGSITATWPVEASYIQLVMTPAVNTATYYAVPYAVYAVTAGPFGVAFVINISDNDLINTATEVTANQNLLTQTPIGTGPFLPFKLIQYGGHMVYLTYDGNGHAVAYISDVDAGQQITEQYNKRALPGFKKISSGFVVRGLLYLLGPNWTYALEDTQGYPVTWPSMSLVDGGIGTDSVDGVLVSSTGDFAVVVHVTGAYVFDGVYGKLPISYMVDPQWKQINWNAQATIRIALNTDKKQILIAVPLGTATTPNYLFTFDYTNGLDPESIQFSPDNVTVGTSGYPRGMTTWNNPSTHLQETIISANGNAGKLLRQMNANDTNPYRDDTTGVGGATGSLYELAQMPSGRIAEMYKHIAAGVRITGNGTPTVTSYNLDRTIANQWSGAIALQANPGKEYFRQFNLNAEKSSTRFAISGLDNYFILSGYRHQYTRWAARR